MKIKRWLMLAVLGVSGAAYGTDLNLTVTCDDAFEAFISTNDAVEGTSFLTDDNWWPTVESGSVTLTPGITHYLHIKAWDIYGSISSLIASASLDDALFQFDNATQSLDTDTTNWGLSKTGWGINDLSVSDYGANGASPWGAQAGINAGARFIWSDTVAEAGVLHYFSVKITPVPEPATLAVLGLGAATMLRRRRRNA